MRKSKLDSVVEELKKEGKEIEDIEHDISYIRKKLIEKEEKEIEEIEHDISYIRDKLIEKRPSTFSKRNVVNAFFGSLIIGMTFMFKGNLIRVIENLQIYHVFLIISSTLLILTAQIYFISYTRVKNKKKRPFRQFLFKRLTSLYLITWIVSIYLVYIFSINSFYSSLFETFKMTIVLSMPCAIGAAVPSLLKQY